jgi:hypothetical protein
MSDSQTAMQQAYVERLPVPLEKTTLGQAFKALLEYHRDQKYPWALADDLMFSIDIELGEPEKAGGIMGFLGMTKPGEPTAIIVALERALDSISNDDEDVDDDAPERFESIMLELEYPVSSLTTDELEEFSGLYEDSTEYDTLEEFVKAVLENPAFVRLALLPASRVEVVADNEIV